MKTFLVISDTHSITNSAEMLIDRYSKVDGLIHLGDYYNDAIILKDIMAKEKDVFLVAGNCDYSSNAPSELLLEIEGKRILLTHGHNYNVKYGICKLEKRAKNEKADAVLFGHTHIPLNCISSSIVFLNPGSIVFPRDGVPTYGLLHVSKNSIDAKILTA